MIKRFLPFGKGWIIDMNLLRKNQIIIYTFALLLVTAGYLNYTSNVSKEVAASSITQDISANADIAQEEIVNESIEENAEENASSIASTEEQTVQETVEKAQEENKIADIGDATLVSSNDVVTDYYAKSKLERDAMYSQMIETYEKILNSSNSLETQKQTATQEITKINETKNKIMICENLIQTKGFENCVVFVNDESVSVIVGATKLKTEEIAQIQNIIDRELNVDIEDIHISTK